MPARIRHQQCPLFSCASDTPDLAYCTSESDGTTDPSFYSCVAEQNSSSVDVSLLSDLDDTCGDDGGICGMDTLVHVASDEEADRLRVLPIPPNESRARVLHALELIAFSFLQQIASDHVRLTLMSRSKASEDGCSSRRTMHWPIKSKNGTFRRFARLFRVVDLICEALTNDIPMTKRELFYKDVSLFGTQSIVNDLVDDLAATIGATRADLNVRSSAKGLFFGSGLKIHLDRGGLILGNCAEPTLIPSGAEISRLELDDISWVLVVEKETIFQNLCRINFSSNPLCPGSGIVITGKGYPDLATRELVCRLAHSLPASIPILALVDADAHGLEILSVYKYGSVRLSHEGHKTICSRIEWLGLCSSELMKLGVDRDKLLPLTKQDHKKALDMLRRENIPPPWRRELSHMLHLRRKAEIEILSSSPGLADCQAPSQMSLPRDLFQLADEPLKEPTLLTYLVSKLRTSVSGSNKGLPERTYHCMAT